MTNEYAVYAVIFVAYVLALTSCEKHVDGPSPQRIVIESGAYSFVAPEGWRRYCCEDAPPDMRGEAHFDRSRFGTHEEFTIGVIPPSAYPRVMEAIQKDPPSVKTVDGDYVYYESKAESKSDHYVIFTRVVGYKDRLFGMGYHAKNLNVHVGDTLETSSLPPEIEEAIRSFRVIEEAEVATDAGDG